MTRYWVVDALLADNEKDQLDATANNCDGGIIYTPLEQSPIPNLPGVWEPPAPTPEEIAAQEAAYQAQQLFITQSAALLAQMEGVGLIEDVPTGVKGPIRLLLTLQLARELFNPQYSPLHIPNYKTLSSRVPLEAGSVVLDNEGAAVVTHNLDRTDYVPVLTPLGGAMPNLHAIKPENQGANAFSIAGGTPNERVAYIIQPK